MKKRGIVGFLVAVLSVMLLLQRDATPYYLSVGAIFRDEARFLEEWIEYHRLVGVDHFYLYNNLSEDDYQKVLAPYIERGIVELVEWPFESTNQKDWNTIQCSAYEKMIREKKKETFWLAIIDTDEFLCPIEHKDLKSFLHNYEAYGGVGINWQLFGTNHVERVGPNQTMIGLLDHRAPKQESRNRFIKSIIRPQRVKKMTQPHFCRYKAPFYHVDENKSPLPKKSLSSEVNVEKICLHHYTYRDEAFLLGEKARRIAAWNPNKTFQRGPGYDEEEDKKMARFVPALEEILFNNSRVR